MDGDDLNECTTTSLPSRERGLKLEDSPCKVQCHWSLPSRERGLKFTLELYVDFDGSVAPLAGAWIEILRLDGYVDQIESLPSRERGLK